MHDPMTVAFDIKYPWRSQPPSKTWPNGYRSTFITIWHVDPEKGGSDDSCHWFRRPLTTKEKAFAASLIDNEYDNLRNWFSQFISLPCPNHGEDHESCDVNNPTCKYGEFVETCDREDMRRRVEGIFSCYIREFRWRYPVRWHFWHWKIQIHPLEDFKRWAFSRCADCGGRFVWGYSPWTNSWNGTGPLWFRSEKDVHHSDCKNPRSEAVAVSAKQ
jgi:hypothetical protein